MVPKALTMELNLMETELCAYLSQLVSIQGHQIS